MKSRSSKWACAALGLMLAVGFLPALASAQGTVTAGTATQVGPSGPPLGGRGKVSIAGTFPCPLDLNLTKCDLVIHKILVENDDEFVQAASCIKPPIPPKRGSKLNDAVFETDARLGPACRVQIKNRGRHLCEFQLKVDRAVIAPDPGDHVNLETAFDLAGPECTAATFDATASWGRRANDPGNFRAPRP